MQNLKFKKESTHRWYIDLPQWQGNKEDLEMVSGADDMLNYMSDGGNEVILSISEEYFNGSDKLIFIEEAKELENGAYYKLPIYRGIEIDLLIWLCDVTKFVFNDKFPTLLYISKIN